jgi:nucleoside-diphosphate-sugar epimerase
MPPRILLTGATGAVGGALLSELLERENEVFCLIRPLKHLSVEARLRRVTSHPRALAVAGDITRPLCGIDPSHLPHVDKLVHAAADTRLNHASKTCVLEANLVGTRHVLQLANAIGSPEFIYIGTAYMSGDAPILAKQGLGDQLTVGASRNPYVTSKVEAEREVRSYRGCFSVMRPSIVVGRSDNGSATLLENWYGFFRSMWRLREFMRHGNFADEHGQRIGRGYKLQVPVAIPEADRIELNLIQIDWLSRATAALLALPASGRTYNPTHPHPIRLLDLMRLSLDALDLGHVELIKDEGRWTLSPIKLAVQRLIQRELDHLGPYLRHAPHFESRNLYTDLGPGWPEPPSITSEFIRMTMQAAERSWSEQQRL